MVPVVSNGEVDKFGVVSWSVVKLNVVDCVSNVVSVVCIGTTVVCSVDLAADVSLVDTGVVRLSVVVTTFFGVVVPATVDGDIV